MATRPKTPTKTQTYANVTAAVKGAVKRGESSVTFKLPASKAPAKGGKR